jgi:predicted RNA-binding Zn-ribbon protein involved in translation (DUF1610 family)
MATYWKHECPTCGYSFETSGPHEFYRDDTGELQHYGHPLPESQEARGAGIWGFYAHAWCLNRDQNVDVVTREFEHPVPREAPVWIRGALPEKHIEVIVCPACGDDSPVMGEIPYGADAPCPRCGGAVEASITRMS